jgi:hypothetical protein
MGRAHVEGFICRIEMKESSVNRICACGLDLFVAKYGSVLMGSCECGNEPRYKKL